MSMFEYAGIRLDGSPAAKEAIAKRLGRQVARLAEVTGEAREPADEDAGTERGPRARDAEQGG